MSYIGSTPTTQSFIAGTDSFNGTGSQTDFTLSRLVNSVNDVQVVVNNVVQYPPNYSVSSNTLTISPAPSAGTNNVYVRYLSTTLQSITVPGGSTVNGTFGVSANSSSDAVRITQTGTGNALVVEDSANPDSTPFVVDTNGRVINGAMAAVLVDSGGSANYISQIVGAANTGQLIYRASADGVSPKLYFAKSRGTVATPSVINSGDALGVIEFGGNDGATVFQAAEIAGFSDGTPGTNDMPGRLVFSTTADGASTPTERMRLDSLGNLKFNSGYGSVATAYGCRAWVNFNGTGTVAIRASGNVSSITDNGTGDYTVNFTTALPDANYSWELNVQNYSGGDSTICIAAAKNVAAPTTSALRIGCLASGVGPFDPPHVTVAIFR